MNTKIQKSVAVFLLAQLNVGQVFFYLNNPTPRRVVEVVRNEQGMPVKYVTKTHTIGRGNKAQVIEVNDLAREVKLAVI